MDIPPPYMGIIGSGAIVLAVATFAAVVVEGAVDLHEDERAFFLFAWLSWGLLFTAEAAVADWGIDGGMIVKEAQTHIWVVAATFVLFRVIHRLMLGLCFLSISNFEGCVVICLLVVRNHKFTQNTYIA